MVVSLRRPCHAAHWQHTCLDNDATVTTATATLSPIHRPESNRRHDHTAHHSTTGNKQCGDLLSIPPTAIQCGGSRIPGSGRRAKVVTTTTTLSNNILYLQAVL